MKPELVIKEFFIEGGKQKQSHVLLHITEPTTPQEFLKGYFFALIEIKGGKVEHIQFIQELIDDIEAQYYSDMDISFEEVLEAANRRTKKLVDSIQEIHCIAGVIQDKKILFSYHGEPKILLFYKKKERLYSLDILDGNIDEPNGRLFSEILEGGIGVDDFFFVGTPNVGDAMNGDRLLKLLDSRTLDESSKHVEKVLSSLRSQLSYGGIFFHRSSKKRKTGKRPTDLPIGSTSSVKALAAQAHITDSVMSSNILHKGRRTSTKVAKQKMSVPPEPQEPPTNYRPREINNQEGIFAIILVALGKGIAAVAILFFKLFKSLFVRIGKIAVGLIVIATNHGNNRRAAINAMKKWFSDKKLSVTSLPILSKVLFLVTIIFAGLFVGSIYYLKAKETKEIAANAYTQLIESIINKKDAADAAIIYGDDEKALTLLQEARGFINNMPTDTEEKLDKQGELTANIELSLQKLQKLTTLSPTILADIGAIKEGVSIESLAIIDDKILAYGPNDKTLYRIDVLTGSIEQTAHETINSIRLASTPKENDVVTFIHDDSRLAGYDKGTKAVITQDVGYPNEGVRIGAISVYNQRLYSVDVANNAIYKHGKTSTGFDKGTSWMKSDADLSEARDIAIDGDIFVLRKHDVLKFNGGIQEEFSVSGIDPVLDSATVFWTYNDVEFIYILEPTNKRVLVLSKKGKLVDQFTALEWDNPTGMVVDTEREKIYVLDGGKVYSFEIK